MNQRNSLSPAGKLTVAALLVAALGFAIQIVSGVEVPTIPPGLVILLVATALVAFLPWRWTPGVGAFIGLFLFVGFFASGAVVNLVDPTRLGVLTGAWVQFVALLVAAGTVAIIQNYNTRLRGTGRASALALRYGCPDSDRSCPGRGQYLTSGDHRPRGHPGGR